MKKKKILAAVAAMTILSAAFTGCSGNNNSSSSDTSSSAAESGNSSGAENSSNSENSDNSSENSSEPATAERTAADISAAAFEALDWVPLQEINTKDLAETMFGIDLDLCEDYSMYNPLISAHMDEMIVVKPKQGSEEKLKEQLDAHYTYLKESAAFYPDQEYTAAGTVTGVTDDGFYYIICNEIGSQIEEIIRDYKPGDTVPKLELPKHDYEETVPTDELGDPIYGSDIVNQPAVDPGDAPAVID